MEDQSLTRAERSGFLWKEETRRADLDGGKEMAVCSSNKDQVSPGIAPRQPSTEAMEEANKKKAATSDGMTVQAIKTNQKRDSCVTYVQHFDHNHIPHQSTACEEEFHVLDLSVRPTGARAVQENRCEEESHVSAERAAGKKVRENSKNRDGPRKRGQTRTEKKPFYKKRLTQNVSSTSCEGTHTEFQSYICQECGKSFSSFPSFTEHQRSHTGYLTEQQGTYAWGNVDVSSERSNKEDEAFKCFECGVSFISFPSFTEHQRSHLGDAAQHQRIHPWNELYICSECGHSFYSFSLFTEHQKSHTKDQPFMIGKGHILLPWMHPGSPEAALGPRANSAPLLGQASYPLSHTLTWGPYSLPHPTLSGTPFMLPFLAPRSYTQTPLPPTQASGCYTPGPTSSALRLTGSLAQERGPIRSVSQKEAGATLSGGNFTGGKEIPTEVSENQAETPLRLNPPQMLDISQRNQAGQSLFPCLDCGEFKPNPTQLALHRRDCKREGLLRCPRCKKRFPNVTSLRQHEKVHMSENS